MAADIFKQFIKAALTGGSNVDVLTEDVKFVLVDTDDYTVDLDNHDFLDDIPAGARVATSANLTGKAFSGLDFDADDQVLSAVSGDEFEAIVGYIDTGVESTSRLVWYDDSIPATDPGGQNVSVCLERQRHFHLNRQQSLFADLEGRDLWHVHQYPDIGYQDRVRRCRRPYGGDRHGRFSRRYRCWRAGCDVRKSGSARPFTALAFDAADLAIAGVTGDQFEDVIGYIDSGSDATSRLLFRITSATGLSVHTG